MTIKAILFDIAGVLHEDTRPVTGAVQAVERARAAGLGVRFVTNTSRTTRATLLGRLREMKFSVAEDVVGACQSGLHGILVRTGEFQGSDEDQLPGQRARVVRDVAEAVGVILGSAEP